MTVEELKMLQQERNKKLQEQTLNGYENELQRIDNKYKDLVCKGWEAGNNIPMQQFFNEYKPELEKQRQKEIEQLKLKYHKN